MPIESKYQSHPGSLAGHTIVRCMHDYHGDFTLYIPDGEFQEILMPTIRTLWANGYTFLIHDPNR